MERVFQLSNDLKELGRIRDELESLMLDLAFEAESRSDIQLVCEEVLANIIQHGLPESEVRHRLRFAFVFDGQSLTLSFEDDGRAFDPLMVEDPDLDAEESDRQIGGLGVYLIKQLTDTQDYERDHGTNRLTVRKTIELQGIQ
jgi:serine/threonine-protein kinase RsbW